MSASGKDRSQTSCDIILAATNMVSNVRQINTCIHAIVELCLRTYLTGLTECSEINKKIRHNPFQKHRKVTESSLQG